jgi:hypothetical protein
LAIEPRAVCCTAWVRSWPVREQSYRLPAGSVIGVHRACISAAADCLALPLLTQLYGPAVRCKRFRRSWRCGLASMYPAFDWSMCSRPSWISARMRSNYRRSLERAVWVTSVRTRAAACWKSTGWSCRCLMGPPGSRQRNDGVHRLTGDRKYRRSLAPAPGLVSPRDAIPLRGAQAENHIYYSPRLLSFQGL